MPPAPYRIHAVRYAHRDCTTSEAFYGDHHNGPMAMDYFVWALTNGSETVVVDLGFTEAVGTARGRQFLRPIDRGLAEVGVDCTQVQHVVLSHFHYDHVGNYALVPQRELLRPGRGDGASTPGATRRWARFARSVEVEDICALIRLNFDRRLVFVDGGGEVVPGVNVQKVGGHTAGHADRHRRAREGPGSGGLGRLALLPELRGAHPLQHAPRPAGNVPRLRHASATWPRARTW